MKFIWIFFISLSLTPIFTTAQSGGKKEVSFKIKKVFATIEGRIEKFDYKIIMNDDGLGKIFGTAEVVSINTGNPERDANLQTEDWFDALKNPRIEILSKKIFAKNKNEFAGTFEIKIKGKSQTMEIPFRIETNGTQKILSAVFNLSISSFDIGGGIMNLLVGDNVTVELQLSF